jgi:serine protease
MKRILTFFQLLLIFCLLWSTGSATAQKNLDFDIKYQKPFNEHAGRAVYASDRIVLKYENDFKPFRVVKLRANENVEEEISKYKNQKGVVYAGPSYFSYIDALPNDFNSSLQWHLDNASGSGIEATKAWDLSRGEGVKVAVIDTGLNLGGNDTPKCVLPGWDFVNNDNYPNDLNGHGTHVSGTIAQNTNNGYGVAGVAYEACIMPIKAMGDNGSGLNTDIVDAIYYAINNDAQIINMSLGSSHNDPIMAAAVKAAYDNGVVVVAAAGNNSSSALYYPAAYESVISVGATDYDKKLASYSNYGSSVDLVAPGGDMYEYKYNRRGQIVSTTIKDLNGDGYPDGVLQETYSPTENGFSFWFYQGTSMAAPHVAGAAALLLSVNNLLTPDEVRTALETSTEDLGNPGKDTTFGYGLVDVYAALAKVKPVGGDINVAPVAVATADKTTIYEGDTVYFDASGSYDADGDTLSFSWKINGVLVSNEAGFSYIFDSAGMFTADLAVSDGALSSNDSIVIEVVSSQEPEIIDMYSQLTINPKTRAVFNSAEATIIVTAGASGVGGALVSGTWSGDVKGSASGFTNSSGQIFFSSPELRKAPSAQFIFTINSIVKDGYLWQGTLVE